MIEIPSFITSNPAKAEQLSQHLKIDLNHLPLDIPEIQSLSLEEVVELKAKSAFEITNEPVLVEDTSLTFHALGRLPGPLIKWFLKELDNEGLCRLIDGYADRSATASTLFGYYDGITLMTFDGIMHGTIADKPRGTQGFGWDPIFIPEGFSETWGEMNKEDRFTSSMRRIALEKLEAYLKTEASE